MIYHLAEKESDPERLDNRVRQLRPEAEKRTDDRGSASRFGALFSYLL